LHGGVKTPPYGTREHGGRTARGRVFNILPRVRGKSPPVFLPVFSSFFTKKGPQKPSAVLFVFLLQFALAEGDIVAVVEALGGAGGHGLGLGVVGAVRALTRRHAAARAAVAARAVAAGSASAAAAALAAFPAVVPAARAAVAPAGGMPPAPGVAGVVAVGQVAGVGVGGIDHHAAGRAFALALAAHALDARHGGVDDVPLVGVHGFHLIV